MILEDKIQLCKTCENTKHLLNMLSEEGKKTALDIMIIDNADKYAIENNILKMNTGGEWLPVGEMTSVFNGVDIKFFTSTNSTISFYIKTDDTLWTIGYPHNGNMGIPDDDVDLYNPEWIQVPNVTNVKDMFLSYETSFLLKNDGTLWSCGRNQYGKLGLGDTIDRNVFTQVPVTDVKEVYIAYNYLFLLKNDGTLWSVGYNEGGQLGLGDTTDRNVFTQVPITDMKEVYITYSYSFLLKNDGTVWSCGYNGYGELGLDDTINRNVFTQVPVTDVKKIHAGEWHTFIIDMNDKLWSVGRNDYGQLGLGDTTNRSTFTDTGMTAKHISSHYDCIFIIDMDNRVWSTGRNNSGQLGLGDTVDRNAFTDTGINALNVFLLEQSTVILTTDNDLYVTGLNYTNGNTTPGLNGTIVNVFTKIPFPHGDIFEIIPSAEAIVIVTDDRDMYGLSGYSYGQLGFDFYGEESVLSPELMTISNVKVEGTYARTIDISI